MQSLINNRWFVLVFFSLLAMVSTLDRFMIAPLITPVKLDLQLSDQEVARAMMAFTYTYALLGPLFGFLGDRGKRKPIIIGALLLWSVASLGSGLATGLFSLLLWRVLVGAGEGAHNSLASSWVADSFASGHKKIAFTVISIVGPMGYSLALIAGSAIAQSHGWRTAFFISGVPGLILAVILFFMREPVQQAYRDPQDHPPKPSSTDIRALIRMPAFLLMILADTLLEVGRGTASFWGATHLHRAFDIPNSEAAAFWGFAYLIFGLIGPVVGGFGVARLLKTRGVSAYPLWSAVSLLLCIATGVPALLADTLAQAKFWYALNVLFATAGFALHVLFLFEVVPANLRGTALAIKVSVMTVAANLMITELVGALSDRFGLSLAMWTSPVAFTLALFTMLLLAAWLARK
ncbi:MFS transporter [Methylobacillus methanolivorans]